jgi:hypothetical protein
MLSCSGLVPGSRVVGRMPHQLSRPVVGLRTSGFSRPVLALPGQKTRHAQMRLRAACAGSEIPPVCPDDFGSASYISSPP